MKIFYLLKFDKRLRYWYLCVVLVAYTNFAFCSDENLRSDVCKSEKETRRKKIKYLSIRSPPTLCRPHPAICFLCLFFILVFFLIIILIIIIIIWINDFYCPIRVHFYPENFYFFSVHFIVNELKSSHFLASEIFVKISSLKSLATYPPEIRKIFRLSQNLTKLFWVTRFRETNLTA